MLLTPEPIIAAVNGDAIGLGMTLALFSNMSIVAEDARLGDTHVKVGLVAGDGGAVVWPLLEGPERAKGFLMRGKLIRGVEPEADGLPPRRGDHAELIGAAQVAARLAVGQGRDP